MTDRLAKLIHHISTLCDPDRLGRTRIAKIIWFSDVEYFRQTGHTISGADDYVKDEYGPRHRQLYDAINLLKNESKIVERPELTGVGTTRYEYIPMSAADVSQFTGEEIAIVDRITNVVAAMSARQASDLTHDELWESAYFNERIPVAAAAPVAGELTPEIIEWAESIFHEHRTSG
jgi:hypothetical protein